MECPNCSSKDVDVVHGDSFVCYDCGSSIQIDYGVCNNCNFTFRSNNGRLVDGSIINESDIEDFVAEMMEEMDEFYREEPESMSEFIHKCLKCGSMAYKNGDVYKCSICSFKWEILPSVG